MPFWKLQNLGLVNPTNNGARKELENMQEPICYIRKGTKRVHESTDYEESHFGKSMGPIKIFKKSSDLVEQPEIIEIYRQPLVIVQKHSQKSSTLSKINSEFDRLILQKLDMIMQFQQIQSIALKKILIKLDTLPEMPNCALAYATQEEGKQKLALPEPIETIAELDNFEQNLCDNSKFRERVVKTLTEIGGHNMRQAIRLMLDRLLHDNLAAQFSFFGKSGKYAFSAYTKTIGIMLQGCKENPRIGDMANLLDLKISLSDSLKNAYDRVTKRLKKINSCVTNTQHI